MVKERRVAVDTASLAGGEISYLKYAPLLAQIRIIESANALTHLSPKTPITSWGSLWLGNDSLNSISSIDSGAKGLVAAQYDVGLVYGAQKLKSGDKGQVPVLIPAQVLEHFVKRDLNATDYGFTAFNYLKNKVIKLTPELFAEYSVRTQEDLEKLLKDHNATGFCYDTNESRFLVGSLLFEWVMSRTILVTIPVFKDPAGADKFKKNNLIAEGNDLLNGKLNSGTVNQLNDIKVSKFAGIFVLSFDPSKLPGICGFIPYPKDVSNAIKPLVDAVNLYA